MSDQVCAPYTGGRVQIPPQKVVDERHRCGRSGASRAVPRLPLFARAIDSGFRGRVAVTVVDGFGRRHDATATAAFR